MKKLISTMSVLLTLVVGALAVPQAASASTQPQNTVTSMNTGTSVNTAAPSETALPPSDLNQMAAGYYEYICLGVDGNSWSLSSGQPLTDCHGSKLLKYINGSHVATYNLSPTGQILDHASSGGCVLAFAAGAGMILWPPTGAVAWVYTSVVNAMGFTSCIA